MAKVDDWDIRYGLSHPIAITPGGPLATIAEAAGEDPAGVMINSLSMLRPPQSRRVIEAVAVDNALAFASGGAMAP